VVTDGIVIAGLDRVTLEHDEKYETEVDFIPQHTDEDKKSRVLLYTIDQAEPPATTLPAG
jgi:hypothetical protein